MHVPHQFGYSICAIFGYSSISIIDDLWHLFVSDGVFFSFFVSIYSFGLNSHLSGLNSCSCHFWVGDVNILTVSKYSDAKTQIIIVFRSLIQTFTHTHSRLFAHRTVMKWTNEQEKTNNWRFVSFFTLIFFFIPIKARTIRLRIFWKMILNKLSNFAEKIINNNIEIEDSHVLCIVNFTMMQQHLFSIKCGRNKCFMRSMTQFLI